MDLFSLFFILTTLIPQIAVSQPQLYCIGDVFNLTWNEKNLAATEVDVVLYWGNNLNWTLATKQDNTGFASVGGDLGKSTNQLSIANGTNGTFYVEGSVNGTVRDLFAADVIICQSIIFGTPGRAVEPDEYIHDVVVSLRQSLYMDMGGENAQWQANFVSVDEEKMEWTVEEELDIEPSAPTAAPTKATTTTSTTTTTTTTSAPKPGQPTQFFSTASPNNGDNSESGGLSLADALRKVSLGSEDPNIQVGLSDCSDPTAGLWCQVNLTVKIPEDAKLAGPFAMAIGVTEVNATDDKLQYYGVNSDSDRDSLTTMFLVYNSTMVDITFTTLSDNNLNDTIFKYEAVGMDIDVGDDDLNSNIELYVVAKAYTDLATQYALECGESRVADDYVAFGWRTLAESGFGNSAELPPGHYEFELYWAVDDYSNVIRNSDFYQLGSDLMDFHVYDEKNGSVVPPVTLKTTKYSRNSKKLDFETSFNGGTMFEGYVVQCNITCRRDGNSTFNFTTDKDGSAKGVEVDFSHLYDTDIPDDENVTVPATYLHVMTVLCDNETVLNTTILLEIGKSSSSNNSGLSAGAIVGIVCAGVLVLGLAAWWLCMKKSGGDGYRELNE